MNQVTLITGGARSGKSRYALELASGLSPRVFIATAQPIDREMRQRIEKHRAERGDAYRTVEAPLDVAGAIETACRDAKVAVVDCLTVWLGNLMHHHGVDRDPYQEVCALLECLKHAPCELILVSNEIGMGLIPENPLGRQFRDTAGRINQAVGEIADNVIFMVSGIPLKVKEFVP